VENLISKIENNFNFSSEKMNENWFQLFENDNEKILFDLDSFNQILNKISKKVETFVVPTNTTDQKK
jgi:hypothetical protein